MVNFDRIARFRRTAGAAAALMAISAGPLLAQQGPRTPPSASAQSSGPKLQLSMEQAVTMAVEANLGLKSSRLDTAMASQDVVSARASFLPFLTTGFNRRTTSSPPLSLPDGTVVVAGSNTLSASGRVQQQLKWFGARYDATWSANRNEVQGGGSTFNPGTGSTVQLNYTQPILRGFKTDSNRVALESAERRRSIADLTLETQVVSLRRATQLAYLNLIGALNGRDVAQQNMDLAQESLRGSRAKVAVGSAPPIDVIQAQASVANNQDQIILAESNIASAEDALRQLILDPSRPDYWTVQIQPTDKVLSEPREIDVEAAVKGALTNRLDLLQFRRSLEISALGLRLTEDTTKTALDAFVNFSSSGAGGTSIDNGVSTVRPFTSVLGDAFGSAYPTWTVGVSMSYPLGHNATQAALARGKLQKQKDEIDLRNAEVQVSGAVRNAARQVLTNFQRVRATEAALKANQDQLTAEQKKNEAGLSTQFELLQKQSLLAQANINMLNAVLAYNQSLILFEAVQRIR